MALAATVMSPGMNRACRAVRAQRKPVDTGNDEVRGKSVGRSKGMSVGAACQRIDEMRPISSERHRMRE